MNLSLEQLSLIFTVINSTFLALLFLYLKFGIEKRLKKYEYVLSDVGELNKKMHDRLVEAEEYIIKLEPIPNEIIKRLKMNASRLRKYDSTIPEDVENLLDAWGKAFLNTIELRLNRKKYSNQKTVSLEIIKQIKNKVDKLQPLIN